MSEHFTLTISQNTLHKGNFAVYLQDNQNNQEHLLVRLKFTDSLIIDESFIDDLVTLIAQRLTKKLFFEQSVQQDKRTMTTDYGYSKEVVKQALYKMMNS